MSIRRTLKLLAAELRGNHEYTSKTVRIDWPPHPNPKMHWPHELSVPVGRRGLRCVQARRHIAMWIGTAFVWTGPRRIRVLARYERIPPQGGSGTAPPKKSRGCPVCGQPSCHIRVDAGHTEIARHEQPSRP